MAVGAALQMSVKNDGNGPYLVIRPQQGEHRRASHAPYCSMDEVFQGYEGGYVPHEFDWGNDVGEEAIR